MAADLLGTEWRAFLRRRCLPDGTAWRCERLAGITNEMLLITPEGAEDQGADAYVLRRYGRTAGHDELRFELSAVQFLATRGFPVASVIAADDGTLFEDVAGRPCALFAYVPGSVGPNLPKTGSPSLAEGVTAAHLLARMHQTTRGHTFPGSRTERADPIARLSRWMLKDGSDPDLLAVVPGGRGFLQQLAPLLEQLTHALDQDPDLWVGLVHGDVAPNNIVNDPSGQIAALLDFDDCYHSYVVFDVCSILWAWGRAADGRIDSSRCSALVRAYDAVRPMTIDERRLLPYLFAAYTAADATDKISWWWHGERKPRPVGDSLAAQAFLDIASMAGAVNW